MRMSDTVDTEATKLGGERTKSPSARDESVNSKRDSVQVEDTFLIGRRLRRRVEMLLYKEESHLEQMCPTLAKLDTFVRTGESAGLPLSYSVCKTE